MNNYLFQQQLSNAKGLTLTEVVLYTGLVAVIIPLVVIMIYFSSNSRVQGEQINSIVQEGSRILNIISQAVHSASKINSPFFQSSSSSLSLEMADDLKNPTIFYVDNGVLYIKEGVKSPMALSNNRLTVANILFSNVSQGGTTGAVRIELTLSNNLTTKKFYKTITLLP